MNCQKYRHKATNQKQTWLKDFSIMPFFHVVGNESLDSQYLFDLQEQILYVKTPDDYNSLPKKVISAYHAVISEYNVKYIFKTDDDQTLHDINFLNTLSKLILNKTPKLHYGGFIVNVTKPYMSEYYKLHPELPQNIILLKTKYCSGRFYFLSYEAICDLISKRNKIENEYLEDYAIGFHLDDTFKTNMFNIRTNDFFVDTINII
jgi:hypothetical protein